MLEEFEHDMLTRRKFFTVSGAALSAPAWQSTDIPAPPLATVVRDANTVSEPVLRLIEAIVTGAQQLDDQHGSAAATFVADQFGCVDHLLRRATYDAPSGRRLCAALAQLAQTAGFMAHESVHDGAAQRWYFAALHAAHSAGDRALIASIQALMSNQAVTLSAPGDALQLAAAAEEAARHSAPTVRALIAARGGLAYASAGDLSGFRRTRDHALAMLEHAGQYTGPTPRWATYVTRTELDAIAGRSLVLMARRVPGPRHQQLLRDAQDLLRERALAPTRTEQRSALRHSAWLGLAYAHAGDLDQAVTAGHNALTLLPEVTSARCLALLGELRQELAPHARRAPAVGDLIAALNRKLPGG
ncbi:hypothetical protein OG339_47415 (plasmid) [Streptosporangium sp. NBC_01495]|uniref:hypothetical protein n=1 Tax=Streptosporangium sp. NBC_01495 TaxID=2903899 RepID=UPI002E35CB39|nr:hypothetical protein [Streptosporangium sp. NBC_01495]